MKIYLAIVFAVSITAHMIVAGMTNNSPADRDHIQEGDISVTIVGVSVVDGATLTTFRIRAPSEGRVKFIEFQTQGTTSDNIELATDESYGNDPKPLNGWIGIRKRVVATDPVTKQAEFIKFIVKIDPLGDGAFLTREIGLPITDVGFKE